jgi:hypothetical protein
MTGDLVDSIQNSSRLARYFGRLILPVFDIGSYLLEFPRIVTFRPQSYSATVSALQANGVKRLALVAPHPTQPLRFTLENLIGGLVANNFSVVLMVSMPERFEWLSKIYPNLILVNRRRKGRDFGAWKEFIVSLLANQPFLQSLERLILVNDSLYYPKDCADIFGDMTETKSAWACLFENYEHHYHAQSFLLSFGPTALQSPAFSKFWTRYKPYSSRKHSIDKGEVLLSRRMSRALGAPHCVAKVGIVIDKVGELGEPEIRLITRNLRKNNLLDTALASLICDIEQIMGDRPFLTGHFSKTDERRLAVAKDESTRILAFLGLERNPTHTLGLVVNSLFCFPLKRDLGFRASYNVHDILRDIKGFSQNEVEIIEQDLRNKQVQRPRRGIGRLLFEAGRI